MVAPERATGYPQGMIDEAASAVQAAEKLRRELEKLLAKIVTVVPRSRYSLSELPKASAETLTTRASREAAAISGALALPTGPAAMLTVLPDLVAVWQRQSQLVADIAACYGRSDQLDQATLMRCMFGHLLKDAGKDIFARASQRVAVSKGAQILLSRGLKIIANAVVKRFMRRIFTRWVPLIGAAAMAGYTYRDTAKVGEAAIAHFEGIGAKKRRKSKKS